MPTFKTSDNQAWSLDITVGSVKRVKSVLAVDLLHIEGGQPPLVTRLAQDIELLCNVVYVLVQPQATERGIDDEKFGGLLGGEAVQAAFDAFWEGLRLFFLSLKRVDLARVIEKQHDLIRAGVNEIVARVELIDPDAEIRTALPPRAIPILSPGNGSTSSPALSELTPPP